MQKLPFEISEPNYWKLHMLFSPLLIPIWLTKDQITFCLTLHDKVYPPEVARDLDGRLVELYFAIKSKNPIADARFVNYLSRVFKNKMGESIRARRAEAFVRAFMNHIENFPKWKKDEALRRFWNSGELPDGFNPPN